MIIDTCLSFLLMKLSRRAFALLLCALLQVLTLRSNSLAAPPDARPEGRFLFQPKLVWANGSVTYQGTGFLLRAGERYFGATSLHFMNFAAGGLLEAVWLDIVNESTVASFKDGFGLPAVSKFETEAEIEHDFLLMPMPALPKGTTALQLDETDSFAAGMELWFPDKTPTEKSGYRWIRAVVVADEGHVLRIRLLDPVKLQSQSGSPAIAKASGKVIGLLFRGSERELLLCPARSLTRRLSAPLPAVPLAESIKQDTVRRR
ncbi:MAG: hypothetical protein JSR82_18105 [Verrucomicrobia bacterium]|nr:hypothetical protein [Verrucomicrobiota bacterium]